MAIIQHTKDILCDIAGKYFGAKKPINKTTAKITITYAKFGAQNEKWDDLLDAGKSIEMPVRDLLDRLQAGITQQAKSAFEKLFNEAKPLLQRSNDLDDAAKKVHEVSQQSQAEALDLLKPAWKAKDPNKQEHVSQISKAEAICKTNAEELARQEKPRELINSELEEKILWPAYVNLPNKANIPSSSITPAIRRKMGSSNV